MPQDTVTDTGQPAPSIAAASRTKSAIFLALAFIIGLFPLGSSLILHFPDERYYSNGAVIMMQSGDYLTPHTAEGDVRLKKPPFSYWLSLAGMEVFGISAIGSRFFWLVGGAAVLLMTFRFARMLTRNEATALLSAALLAGNLAFLRASFNAIPDLPLTLFMLLGFFGFTGLLFTDDRRQLYALLAYGGTGFAVLTKGLLPLAMVGYVAAYALAVPSMRHRARELWMPTIVVPAIIIFGAWFAYQYLTASSELASDFVGDQLSEKVAIGFGTFFDGITSNLGGLLLPVLLWLAMLLIGSRTSGSRPNWQSIGAAAPFIAGWIIAVAIIFSLSAYASHRYVIPVIPLVCILLAAALSSVMNQRADNVLRAILRVSMILMAGLLAVILLFGLLLLPSLIVLALAVIAIIGLAVLWIYSRNAAVDQLALCFALLLVGAAFISTPVLRGLLLPDIGQVIAAKARPLHLPHDQMLFIGSHLDAAKVRLYMDRDEPFAQMRRFPEAGLNPAIKLVMTNDDSAAETLKAQGFAIEELVAGWRKVEWQPFFAALRARNLIGARNHYGQRAWIATRK